MINHSELVAASAPPKPKPAVDMDDAELVDRLVESFVTIPTTETREDLRARRNELRQQVDHRLTFRAERLERFEGSDDSNLLSLARANGALAAKLEVLAVLAELAKKRNDLSGVYEALVTVAGMK